VGSIGYFLLEKLPICITHALAVFEGHVGAVAAATAYCVFSMSTSGLVSIPLRDPLRTGGYASSQLAPTTQIRWPSWSSSAAAGRSAVADGAYERVQGLTGSARDIPRFEYPPGHAGLLKATVTTLVAAGAAKFFLRVIDRLRNVPVTIVPTAN